MSDRYDENRPDTFMDFVQQLKITSVEDPDLAKEIVDHTSTHKQVLVQGLFKVLGLPEMITASYGDKYHATRKSVGESMYHAMHAPQEYSHDVEGSLQKSWVTLMQGETDKMIDKLSQALEESNGVVEINMGDLIREATMSVIIKFFFGGNLAFSKEDHLELVHASDVVLETIENSFVNPLPLIFPSKTKKNYNAAIEVFQKHIDRTINDYLNNDGQKGGLATHLIDQQRDNLLNGKKEEAINFIQAQTIVMLLAGHETSYSSMTFMCKEIAALLNNTEFKSEDLVNPDIVNSMVLENLRMNPPVSVFYRVAKIPFQTQDGQSFKPNATFKFDVDKISRNPNLYEEPNTFIPQRFTGKNARNFWDAMVFGRKFHGCIGSGFALEELNIMTMGVGKFLHDNKLNIEFIGTDKKGGSIARSVGDPRFRLSRGES